MFASLELNLRILVKRACVMWEQARLSKQLVSSLFSKWQKNVEHNQKYEDEHRTFVKSLDFVAERKG